ncbi:hypothetical protein HMI54_014507 [Coelomomyces lativittatus]|nr:hypothetical protein HMI54_014507 [Coelomomyces lativittatus]
MFLFSSFLSMETESEPIQGFSLKRMVWDAGYGLSVPSVYKSGYMVLGATLVSSALMLAFL